MYERASHAQGDWQWVRSDTIRASDGHDHLMLNKGRNLSMSTLCTLLNRINRIIGKGYRPSTYGLQ